MATKVNHRRRAAGQGRALRKAFAGLGDLVTVNGTDYTGTVVEIRSATLHRVEFEGRSPSAWFGASELHRGGDAA
jgi:hypothetical protein